MAQPLSRFMAELLTEWDSADMFVRFPCCGSSIAGACDGEEDALALLRSLPEFSNCICQRGLETNKCVS